MLPAPEALGSLEINSSSQTSAKQKSPQIQQRFLIASNLQISYKNIS